MFLNFILSLECYLCHIRIKSITHFLRGVVEVVIWDATILTIDHLSFLTLILPFFQFFSGNPKVKITFGSDEAVK